MKWNWRCIRIAWRCIMREKSHTKGVHKMMRCMFWCVVPSRPAVPAVSVRSWASSASSSLTSETWKRNEIELWDWKKKKILNSWTNCNFWNVMFQLVTLYPQHIPICTEYLHLARQHFRSRVENGSNFLQKQFFPNPFGTKFLIFL